MKRVGFILLMIALVMEAALAISVAGTDNNGAEEMTLDAGKKGAVWFPHRQHQDNLGDCMHCHSVFPKEAGAIQKMKAEGALKKKQVMKKVCLSCHRKMKKMKKPAGPTSCKKCHLKK